MTRKIIAYASVFNRNDAKEFDFMDFLNHPEIIAHSFGLNDWYTYPDYLKEVEDKQVRNNLKRNYFPAIDLSMSGILSIDIDNISDKPIKKCTTINRLAGLRTCFSVQETVSGNIVAFFKYDCSATEYPYLYYKIYLELTLLLSTSIDFLPEIGRLRYLSKGEVYYLNEHSEELTEVMECEELPYINTTLAKDKARAVRYKSE